MELCAFRVETFYALLADRAGCLGYPNSMIQYGFFSMLNYFERPSDPNDEGSVGGGGLFQGSFSPSCDRNFKSRGGSRGRGGGWGSGSPPPPPQLYKEGKNVTRMHAKTQRFST